MPALFNATESGFTATAMTLVPSSGDTIDFTKWGNPEREKINEGLAAVNEYLYKRRGVI